MSDAIVRSVTPSDLAGLVGLIHAHTEYERAPRPPSTLADSLPVLLFGDEPRLHGFVAEIDDRLAGYATFSVEASTWRGHFYLHLDCLYLDEGARGLGIGPQLVERGYALAAGLGVTELQWQTPEWNVDAIRFYDRFGATRSRKERYTLDLPAGESGGGERLGEERAEGGGAATAKRRTLALGARSARDNAVDSGRHG